MPPRLGLLAACALLLTGTGTGTAAPLPLQSPIAIDGSFGDWNEVRTNPANTTTDPQGSAVDCLLSTDRDCPLGESDLDLKEFAWTWDEESFYFFVDFHGITGGDKWVFLYVDSDLDERVASGEPLVRLRIMDDSGSLELGVDSYLAAGPSGADSLVDAAGLADGHPMPGQAFGSLLPLALDVGMSADDPRFEGAVPWEALGLAPGAPFHFHVGSAKGDGLPADARDNLGSASGGYATTGWRDLELSGPLTAVVRPGEPIELAHVVRNSGNLPARVDLLAVSAAGFDLVLKLDADGDGFAETLLAEDAGGDGLFTQPGDLLLAGADSNRDGRPDLGILSAGDSARLVIELLSPPGSEGTVDRVSVTARQGEDPAVSREVEDVVLIGELILRSDEERLGTGGGEVWFPHVLDNGTGAPLEAEFDVESLLGWTYRVLEDPAGLGRPSDAVPAPDADGDGRPEIAVAAGGRSALLLAGSVPDGLPPGITDTATLTATVPGLPAALVVDTTTVARPLTLKPDYLLTRGEARYGGGTIYFAHRLQNARGRETTARLEAVSDLGWTVTLLDDPDGDGRPHDSRPLAEPLVTLPANGGFLPFIARLTVPPDAVRGERSRLTISAVAEDEPAVFSQVLDDAIVAIIRTYQDANHFLSMTRTPPCSRVHAQASSLAPESPDYRFTWRDGAGGLLRRTEVTTDSAGTAADARTLGPSEIGGGWIVEIEQWDGLAWRVLDAASFDVEDPLEAEGPTVERPLLHRDGATLRAGVRLANPTFARELEARPRWVVLTPDRGRYLSEDGLFLPYTGTEGLTSKAFSLAPQAGREVTLRVDGVQHPSDGVYEVELWLDSPCAGPSRLAGVASYEVADDEDEDLLTRDEELAAGTDPADADSDDDGLIDGLDGLADSDGDGAIDALDCDSDGDGLADGLESGLDLAHADTDPGAGCWSPDADTGTTTDPDLADTDGGGVPDGLEDLDRDGAVDVGEGDPNEAADDLMLCSRDTPAELTGLRLRRLPEAVRLAWDEVARDACTHEVVLFGAAADALGQAVPASGVAVHADPLADQPPLRFYLVRADSLVGGPGATGR